MKSTSRVAEVFAIVLIEPSSFAENFPPLLPAIFTGHLYVPRALQVAEETSGRLCLSSSKMFIFCVSEIWGDGGVIGGSFLLHSRISRPAVYVCTYDLARDTRVRDCFCHMPFRKLLHLKFVLWRFNNLWRISLSGRRWLLG